MDSPKLLPASDHSLLVSFGDEISLAHHQSVVRLTALLVANRRAFIRNIHPAYCSVLVSFDPRQSSLRTVEEYIVSLLQSIESAPLPPPRHVEIPVCYGGEFGPDLADVAAYNNCSPDDVVRIHSSGEYLVYFLGFSPGFPYMGGLSPQIATPRLATPRTRVPAGSVAIGGAQTGIYPVSSPGGWRIIGRTPLKLFRPNEEPPVFLHMGDIVHFLPITHEAFARLTNP
jgi:inhibitor of KinA